jgi:hypothetical protein
MHTKGHKETFGSVYYLDQDDYVMDIFNVFMLKFTKLCILSTWIFCVYQLFLNKAA